MVGIQPANGGPVRRERGQAGRPNSSEWHIHMWTKNNELVKNSFKNLI